jgi:hypothetical protein
MMPETRNPSAAGHSIPLSTPRRGGNTRGFTLVELLVLITIIVVLLAMLAPALDRAIYAAELVSCAAQQDGIASGAMLYAMNHKRRYPHRAGTSESTSGHYFSMYITLPFNPQHNPGNATGYDDRPLLRPYMSINAMLDPMAPAPVDLNNSAADSFICTSYSLWFGWKHIEVSQDFPPARGMERFGQTWDGGAFGANFFAHADRQGMATGHTRYEEAWAGGPAVGADKNTISLWHLPVRPPGPLFDSNYAFEDGSVRTYRDVPADIPWNLFTREEERFNFVPLYHRVGGSYPGSWLAIPKRP